MGEAVRLWITYDPTKPPRKWFTKGNNARRWFVRFGCFCVSVKRS